MVGCSEIRGPQEGYKVLSAAEGDPKVRQSFFPKPRFEVPNHRDLLVSHPHPRLLAPPQSQRHSRVQAPPSPPALLTIPVLSPASVFQSRAVSITAVDIVS